MFLIESYATNISFIYKQIEPNIIMFQVSVIIPVYNAAKFVRDAVISANNLEEVGEIILVEDGSLDNALEICQQLNEEFEKVRLYTHPNNENRGPGASRNLGILNAKYEYISFLDADDYYLPNRFTITKQVFAENPECDGVYEASSIINEKNEEIEFVAFSRKFSPEKLFQIVLIGKLGRFNTNSITLKRYVFDKHLFNTKLNLHQDTELWYRLAYHFKLLPGNIIERTNIVRRHSGNRIIHRNNETYKLFLKETLLYFYNIKSLDNKNKKVFNNKLMLTYFAKYSYLIRAITIISYKIMNFLFPSLLFKINYRIITKK